MKRNLSLAMLLLSIVVAWFFGYINFPFINQSQSFWVGLIGGVSILVIIILLTSARVRSHSASSNTTKSKVIVPIVFGILAVIVLFLYNKNQSLESRIGELTQQNPSVNSISSSQQVEFLKILNSLLDTVGYELRNSENKTLSPSTIGRIVAFSQLIGSHQFIATDTGVYKKTSPVKGHLLLSLIQMKMDSASFNKIKQQVSFEGADLSKANLSGFDLEGINLKEANLAGASLKGTNLSNSDLFGSNLSEANLENASFNYSTLKRANLTQANLSKASMINADMERVNLSNAIVNEAKLKGTKLNESLIQYALFKGTDLSNCAINGANLRGANLDGANLVNVKMKYSILASASLDQTQVDSFWLKNLEEWGVNGRLELSELYEYSFDSLNGGWFIKSKH